MSLTAENGTLTFDISNGSEAQSVRAENAYAAGSWVTVSVVLENDSAKLVVNDGRGMKITYGTVTIDPVEVMSDNATYIIADGMNGSMDYFRVNFKEVSEPDYYYTETETIMEKVRGDINADGYFNISDLVLLRLLDIPDANLTDWKAGDLGDDNRLDILDLCLMKHELLKSN